MKQQLQEISEKQKESWNQFSPGWKKWDTEILDFMKPMGDAMIDLLKPKGSEIFLDIAGGTGEPGLSIAAKLKGGKVIITDLANGMLNIARENASKRGITNVEFQVCDVSELSFADNTFDGVSCRMGFMFFPDMLIASKEILRVLKPGGRFATAVWSGPEKNFWVASIGGAINKNMELTPPPPGAPGMFRCAKSGLMMDIFQQAGFKNVSEKEVIGELKCGSAEGLWTMMTEIAAPFSAALNKADDAMKEKIKREVYEMVNEKYPAENIIMDGSSLIIYGEK